MSEEKITAARIRSMKGSARIAALTAYDYPLASLLDAAEIPLILVGDSLGMVVLGYPDTTHVTMADMEHHVRAAARARPNALLAADLPYQSYETPEEAVCNAQRLIDAGAEAVKTEGGHEILPQVEAIVTRGIPLISHLGMLPQSVHREGGYHMKGKRPDERERLLEDADSLARAGAFALVLELVRPAVAREITQQVSIPTIGIGSGQACDGQILVTTDLLGFSPNFIPKHVTPLLNMAGEIRSAVQKWKTLVTQGSSL